MKRRNTLLIFLLVLAVLLIIGSIFADSLAPNDPDEIDVNEIKTSPCDKYPLGTDGAGRCILSRILHGAKTSIFSALILVLITAVFGSIVGLFCGYYAGKLDKFIMRIIDGIMAFPQMVLAIAVSGVLGGGMVNAMIALGFASWAPYTRLARSRVISIKNETYITGARLSGCSDIKIIFSYILPGILNSLITYATSQISTIMLGFAGLSFLGLGVQLPEAEWGSMISESRGMLGTAPWAVLYPALALVITVMIFNLLGDVLRDRSDIQKGDGKI